MKRKAKCFAIQTNPNKFLTFRDLMIKYNELNIRAMLGVNLKFRKVIL